MENTLLMTDFVIRCVTDFWHIIGVEQTCGQYDISRILSLPSILKSSKVGSMKGMSHAATPARSVSNAQVANAIMNVLASQRSGGLEGLVDRFIGKGLGEVTNSWISPFENQPVSDTQIQRVLGRELVGEIAWQARMTKKEALAQISSLLPQVVDSLTPTGRILPGSSGPEKTRLHRHAPNK